MMVAEASVVKAIDSVGTLKIPLPEVVGTMRFLGVVANHIQRPVGGVAWKALTKGATSGYAAVFERVIRITGGDGIAGTARTAYIHGRKRLRAVVGEVIATGARGVRGRRIAMCAVTDGRRPLRHGRVPRAAERIGLDSAARVLVMDAGGSRGSLEVLVRRKRRPKVRVEARLVARVGLDQRIDQGMVRDGRIFASHHGKG